MSSARAALRPAAGTATARTIAPAMVLRGALAMAVTFIVALAAIEIADVAPGDARLRAAVVVALWAVTPAATAFTALHPAVSLRRWAPTALGTSAAWAAAAGVSAAYLDGALSGPDVAVFAGTFGFLFVPLALIVLLVAIVVRLRRLMVRIRAAAATEA